MEIRQMTVMSQEREVRRARPYPRATIYTMVTLLSQHQRDSPTSRQRRTPVSALLVLGALSRCHVRARVLIATLGPEYFRLSLRRLALGRG